MLVPTGASDRHVFIRAHEMGHAKWSPDLDDALASVTDVDPAALQAVEDCRVHHLLDRAGVDLRSGGLTTEQRRQLCEGLANRDSPWDFVLSAVASYGTGDYHAVAGTADLAGFAEAHETAARVRAELAADPTFDRVVAIARELTKAHGRPGRSGYYTPPLDGAKAPDLSAAVIPYPVLGYAPDPGSDEGHVETKIPGLPSPLEFPGTVPWGTMRIEEPPRVLGTAVRKAAFRSQDYGANLRNPHRLLVDQRVFAVKRKSKAASVLIDASGSMNLSEAMIAKVLAGAPASVVAIYSGNSYDGVLRVLAKDGRAVTGDHVCRPAAGYNVIDGPALDWLARQPAPRFWLSDGAVTGIRDAAGSGNAAYRDAVCQAAGIARYAQVADLVRAVTRSVNGRAKK